MTYTYEVTNTGDDPLSDVTLFDDTCSPLVRTVGGANALLDPYETWVYTCSMALTDDTTNVVLVDAEDSLGNAVKGRDEADVDVVRAAISLDKTVDQPIAYATDTVTYTIAAENTGADPLHNVVVSDPNCAPVYDSGDAGEDGVMQPGEIWLYTCQAQLSADSQHGDGDGGRSAGAARDGQRYRRGQHHHARAQRGQGG